MILRSICKFSELPESDGKPITEYLCTRLGERAEKYNMDRMAEVFSHALRVHMAHKRIVLEKGSFHGPEGSSVQWISESVAGYDLEAFLEKYRDLLPPPVDSTKLL